MKKEKSRLKWKSGKIKWRIQHETQRTFTSEADPTDHLLARSDLLHPGQLNVVVV